MPQKGHVHPNRPRLKDGPDPSYSTLTGHRRTTAFFPTDGGEPVERVLEDFWDIPANVQEDTLTDPYDAESYGNIKNDFY